MAKAEKQTDEEVISAEALAAYIPEESENEN